MLFVNVDEFTLKVTTSEVSLPQVLVDIMQRNNWLLLCNEVLEMVSDEVETPEY
jgi:hypothetical protein